MKILAPELARPLLEGRMPADAEIVFFDTLDAALAALPGAEIAWFDLEPFAANVAAMRAAADLKWVFTAYAGLERFPLALLRSRGITLTNGAGLHAIPVAEFTVAFMLAAAKGVPNYVRAQDRREWLRAPPGVLELIGTRALIVGMGGLGRAVAERLAPFGVEVVGVRRTPTSEPGMLAMDAWRARLGEFDWVILAAPMTAETRRMIGAAELSRMKPTAWLVNIARGGLVDQPALIAAARAGSIGGAILDVTDPEPSPPDDPVWSVPNIIVTMHMSGNAQTRLMERAAALFLDNIARHRAGEPLRNVADLDAGY